MTDPRHSWSGGVVRFGPRALGNGCDQTERTCSRCGLVKITVHPPEGLPWIEWRQGEGPQIQLSTTPPCMATQDAGVPA